MNRTTKPFIATTLTLASAGLFALLAMTAAVFVSSLTTSETAEAATKLRLSSMNPPGSDANNFAEEYAKRVGEASSGRITLKVYPASSLGDWVEVHEQVMQGAIDMALQSLSAKFDTGLALAWFPYTVQSYEEAAEAYAKGGYIYEIVDELLAKQDMKLLGVYGSGMGGAGFTNPPENPRDPNAKQDSKIRVWPGGTTHQALMQRFGFQVAPIPWAEVYTARQTGVVDGQIGGTPELEVENFKDITKMWIQYNDHFEPTWLFINNDRYSSLSEEDQKVLLDVAQEMSNARFKEMKEADEKFLQELRDAGAEVVILTDEELANFAKVARSEVWPEIEGEVGVEVMTKLRKQVGSE